MDLNTVQKERSIFYLLKNMTLDKIQNAEERQQTDDYLEERIMDRVNFRMFSTIKSLMEQRGSDYEAFLQRCGALSVESEENQQKYLEVVTHELQTMGIQISPEDFNANLGESYKDVSQVLIENYMEMYPDETDQLLDIIEKARGFVQQLSETQSFDDEGVL